VKPRKVSIPPAVEVYRIFAHAYPPKTVWNKIDKTIGDNQDDLELWGKVVENYILCGWYAGNIKIMLEYFERREIPGAKKPNGAKNGRTKKAYQQNGPTLKDQIDEAYAQMVIRNPVSDGSE